MTTIVCTTEEFDDRLSTLPKVPKMQVAARIDRAEQGNFGDCRSVGEGVLEMRIHIGPGYRVYFVQLDTQTVVLLTVGEKSTHDKDIKIAQELARQLSR